MHLCDTASALTSDLTRSDGVYREPAQAPIRRARLDAMLSAIPALAFDALAANTYGPLSQALATRGESCSTG